MASPMRMSKRLATKKPGSNLLKDSDFEYSFPGRKKCDESPRKSIKKESKPQHKSKALQNKIIESIKETKASLNKRGTVKRTLETTDGKQHPEKDTKLKTKAAAEAHGKQNKSVHRVSDISESFSASTSKVVKTETKKNNKQRSTKLISSEKKEKKNLQNDKKVDIVSQNNLSSQSSPLHSLLSTASVKGSLQKNKQLFQEAVVVVSTSELGVDVDSLDAMLVEIQKTYQVEFTRSESRLVARGAFMQLVEAQDYLRQIVAIKKEKNVDSEIEAVFDEPEQPAKGKTIVETEKPIKTKTNTSPGKSVRRKSATTSSQAEEEEHDKITENENSSVQVEEDKVNINTKINTFPVRRKSGTITLSSQAEEEKLDKLRENENSSEQIEEHKVNINTGKMFEPVVITEIVPVKSEDADDGCEQMDVCDTASEGSDMQAAESLETDNISLDKTTELLPVSTSENTMKNLGRCLFDPRCLATRNPEKAIHMCHQCGFLSTEGGLRKHVKRYHSDSSVTCIICEKQFGLRYEMRRHRMKHFNMNGKLRLTDRLAYQEKYPGAKHIPKLHELEEGFSSLLLSAADAESKDTTGGESENIKVKAGKATLNADEDCEGETTITQVCPHCGYQCKGGMNKHRQRQHPRYTYECFSCDKRFNESQDLYRHVKNMHCKQQDLTASDIKKMCKHICCNYCHIQLKTQKEMTKHLKNAAHPEILICTLCDIKFHAKQEIYDHFQQTHPNLSVAVDGRIVRKTKLKLSDLPSEPQRKHQCTVCEKEFKLACNLAMHMMTHQGVHNCSQCDFKTCKKSALSQHVSRCHDTIVCICDQCGKSFATESTLNFHKKTVHMEGAEESKCQHCNKVFSDVRFMNVHIKRVHMQEKRFFCEVCGKGFFEKIRMKQHEVVHKTDQERATLKKHQCPSCDKKFYRQVDLRQHINTHTGDRPFKCSICQKGFAWLTEVQKHMIVHQFGKPYKCGQCSKAFKTKQKLATHSIVHTKQSRHVCPHCKKVYTLKVTLNRHRCKAVKKAQVYSQEVEDKEALNDLVILSYKAMDNNVQILDSVEQNWEQEEPERVMFMCGICQNLFFSQDDVHRHMQEEHMCAENNVAYMLKDNDLKEEQQETQELLIVQSDQDVYETLEDSKSGVNVITQVNDQVVQITEAGPSEMLTSLAVAGCTGAHEIVVAQEDERHFVASALTDLSG